ncbi:MAG: SGNH/GDSL hydrolase family protein [Clostridia bacterium]
MKKQIKKLLCAALSLTMVAGSAVLPAAASAEITPLVAGDTVLQEWKFDFGAEGATPEEGFTLVTPDKNYVTAKDYGFLGIDEQSYKLGNRLDGFGNQEGQVIELEAGGGTGLSDGIGSVGEDAFGNAGDKYYPTRFALKVADEQYFRVKATVTTLDPTKDANVSLYTSRKHPIIKNTTVAAGETKTVEFSVRTTPIYYEKSTPKGTIADELVNVCVLGENSALAALEIQQVETLPVMWVLGDSTVTDGNATLPYFDLQNYTGVGTGLTMYLPRTMAMVNEGEGGLNAADNNHFNMVKSRIKAGDYMYVEYGHNHKDDGPTGYTANLDKYYEACHSVGAKLIIVSPIERINQWDSATSQYTQSLNGFADAGEAYVAAKVEAGATDIAYVDLNDFSINWYNKITTDNDGAANAIKFYFQTAKGGGTDTTHPNDAGAEHLAYEFMKAAQAVTDTTQKAVVDGFLTNMTTETPKIVSTDITSLGGPSNDAWPIYVVQTKEKYPVVVKAINFDESGRITSADVETRQAEIQMTAYGIIIITVYNEDGTEKGKLYAVDQVDNSTGYGPQTITNFRGDVTLGENDTYSAIVMQALDSAEGLVVDEEANQPYSAIYRPSEITEQLLLNEDGDGNEDFDFYGATYSGDEVSQLSDYNDWIRIGSAGIDLSLGETDTFKYATISSDGAKNGSANQGSCYISKNLANEIGTTGRYMISADFKYVSGGGLNARLVTGHSDKVLGGSEGLTVFTIADGGKVTCNGTVAGTISALNFTNVKYVLDMDLGTATVSVGGGDEVVVDVANYQTTGTVISPSKITQLLFEGNKIAYKVQVANLTVAKLKDQTLPEYTLTVASNDDSRGTVSVTYATEEPTTTEEPATTNEPTEVQTLSADEDVTLSYVLGNAVVKASKEASVTVIEAAYNEDNTLKSVKSTPLTFEEAGEKTVTVAYGSKIMLWDSLEGMKPLASPVNAVIEGETVTVPLNTVVTVSAHPNEGYVFMGWKDVNGKLVSEDAEYTFRLRDNTNLIADYAKEPGVEDITSYSLDATSTFLKADAGATTTMVIVDPVDASGTPMDKVKNSDLTWSCAEQGITVDENGVVTVGSEFSLGDSITKTITVEGKLNGITKTCQIVLHGYTYSEDFSTVTDSWGFTTSGGVSVVDGYLKLLVNSGASSSSVQEKTLEADIAAANKVSIKFDWKALIEATKGRHSYFALMDSSNNVIFIMQANGKDGISYSTTSADSLTKLASYSQNWYTVDLTLDFEAKTINGTIADNTGKTVKTFTDEALNASAASLAKMYATNTYSAAPLAIDNVCIKVY